MHGLYSRYPEEKNKIIAVKHKLLEQVKVVAKEVNFHKSQTVRCESLLFVWQRYGSVYTWYLGLVAIASLLNPVNIDLCFVVGAIAIRPDRTAETNALLYSRISIFV